MSSASTSPERIACRVSSASARRAFRSSISPASGSSGWISLIAALLRALEVEAEQDPVGAGHVPDHPAQREGQLLDQRRRREDLLPARERRLLVDVDHLEVVPSREVLLAD